MQTITSYAPDKTSTVLDLINAGETLSISKKTMSFRLRYNDVIIPHQTLIARYHGAIQNYIIDYEFSDEDFDTYKFQPRKFSQDRYGTPELWADLLYINNMVSITDFKKRKIKVFRSTIIDVITELSMLARTDLKNNIAEVDID